MSISLVMNIKNGERSMDNALLSVNKLADEIIIVNNESTDHTTRIAKKYTDKIYFSRSRNHFGNIRNITINRARSNWVLILDSDEECSNELVKNIPKLLLNENVEGYWFSRLNYININKYLRHGLFYPDYQLRLFRNHKGYKFVGKVHAQLNIPDNKTEKVNLDILHHQYPSKIGSLTNFRYLNKYIKNEALELKRERYSDVKLVFTGLLRFMDMFFNGLIRGKGILDGWDGVRAHFMFASSVFLSYIFAMFSESTIRKYLKTYE